MGMDMGTQCRALLHILCAIKLTALPMQITLGGQPNYTIVVLNVQNNMECQ